MVIATIVTNNILEHLELWEDKTTFERAPPDYIHEKNYEPYDDGRKSPADRLSGHSIKSRLLLSIEPVF
jgi:hypothetical protein